MCVETVRGLQATDIRVAQEEIVFAAQELKYAANELGRVVGSVGVEDVLDALFKDFCIGK